jgi:hypothetical protein
MYFPENYIGTHLYGICVTILDILRFFLVFHFLVISLSHDLVYFFLHLMKFEIYIYHINGFCYLFPDKRVLIMSLNYTFWTLFLASHIEVILIWLYSWYCLLVTISIHKFLILFFSIWCANWMNPIPMFEVFMLVLHLMLDNDSF